MLRCLHSGVALHKHPPAYLRKCQPSQIVGPEAITGSSRMKGGSMTFMLLQSVFLQAACDVLGLDPLGDAAGLLVPAAPAAAPAPSKRAANDKKRMRLDAAADSTADRCRAIINALELTYRQAHA